MKNINIFLSYCWEDKELADDIFSCFKTKKNIELHRDIVDIGTWQSIKEYMQSIEDMDYVILLISDSYLKSANCMYEVLEVMRDRKYKEKIFPAIISTEIYNPIARINYVKYWQDKFNGLSEAISELEVQNQGPLNRDLKRYQDIASNIAEFLNVVSDMNNPRIQDVKLKIEEKLNDSGVLIQNHNQKNDLFEQLGICQNKFQGKPSDLDINQFVKESYDQIIELFSELCKQYTDEYKNVQVQVERVDTRTVIFRFYKVGNLVRSLKIFLGNLFSVHETIGVSDCTIAFSSNTSWNGMYEAKLVDEELKLCATMSMWNRDQAMTCQEIVADIWKNYVQMYLER